MRNNRAMDLFSGMSTFVRVVEAGSLSAAARQLRISTAAVSRHVSGLEAELGTQLLGRTTRRLAMTDAGRRYYERCLRVLREVDEAQAIGRLDGPVRISVPVTLGFFAASVLMQALREREPGLQLDVRLEDRLTDLVSDDVDIALRVAAKPPLTTELVARPLARWRLVLAASPAYVRRRGEPRTPSALAGHDVVSTTHGTETWPLHDDTPTTATLRIPVRHACNAGHVVRDLVRDGAGVALFPDWYIAEDLATKRLRRLLPRWSAGPTEVYALYRSAHRSEPRVKVVLDELQATFTVRAAGSSP